MATITVIKDDYHSHLLMSMKCSAVSGPHTHPSKAEIQSTEIFDSKNTHPEDEHFIHFIYIFIFADMTS